MDAPSTSSVLPLDILYCQVCTFPPEYCEFGSSVSKCKTWLEGAHPELYDKYWSEDALAKKIGTLSLEKEKKLEQEGKKKEAKAEAKASAAAKKLKESQVIIKRIERSKRKYVTSVFGLEAFHIDLKKAAKQLAQSLARGASVTLNPQGLEEIVIQGDVGDEVEEMLAKGVGVLKGVPEDNVVQVEEKK
ncbi:eIF1-like protein [Dacryopinax primogenitus]|uniref:Translation machinery-associated protein 22 n=1 Tax=Dacryopinax primogenitus (strain DJM 731) TaxID=1858805 RepID=M5GC60_DACPD|nr:eIF1-like protein [Dacryopinax primogenitus]EJU06614.1 eIF1-like protein [Dacryopinax primogenitus]